MISAVVAEDNPLVREGVVRILEHGGITVVGVAADADELLAAVAHHAPDVVVTDIRMPPNGEHDGLDAAVAIRAQHPRVGVLVLSQYLEEDYALTLIGERADGVGYLLKDNVVEPAVIRDAVRRVAAGDTVLDPDVLARMTGQPCPAGLFTPRERDVLALMARGYSNAGVAQTLVVSVAAVERHVTNIFAKLGLYQDDIARHRRVLAVLAFLGARTSES